MPHCVHITEGRGGHVGGKVPVSTRWEGIEYMALKANILKIKRTEVRRFFAFAEILSTMDADQLGDFTESKMGCFSRVLSSEWRF